MAMTSLKLETGSAEYDTDIETAIRALLDMETSQGTGYWTDQYDESSDPSSMIMQALAPYANGDVTLNTSVGTGTTLNTNVATVVKNAATQLINSNMYHADTDTNGEVVAHIYDATEYSEANSSSNAVFLSAMVACGLTDQEDGAGNVVTDVIAQGLLNYQVVAATGNNVEADINSFNWADDATYDRHLATQQAVYALDQYQNGTSNWLFNFTNVD
jgi:hypothetical protein